MARKLPGLSRVLGGSSLAGVAYGEVGSSISVALGVVAAYALGATPWVLLAVGGLFLLVSLSYAEGASAVPETGGAAMLARRAFNDPVGFITGWVLFLDYAIVIALSALFVPHYLGEGLGLDGLTSRPWDLVIGFLTIALVAAVRLSRRIGLFRLATYVAVGAFLSHIVLVGLGLALFSLSGLGEGIDLGTSPSWHSLIYVLPLATLAYTGLETAANLASEVHEPGRALPRGLTLGLGAVVTVSVLVGIVGISAYPPVDGTTELGGEWLHAPLVGIVEAFQGHLPSAVVDGLRALIGITGALILLAAMATSMSGIGRLAYTMGQHGMLPHAFGRLSRRSVISPESIVATAVGAAGLLAFAAIQGDEVRSLASLYSFGVLITFAVAQAAVVRLRIREPDLPRPYRVRGNIRIGGSSIPVAALVGIPLTVALWVASVATHETARIAGPIWLLLGGVVYVLVRAREGQGLLEHVDAPVPDLVPETEGLYRNILVPVKIGPIGAEMLATAIKLAEERGGRIHALHVIRVPLREPLDAPLDAEQTKAIASLDDARELAAEHGVTIEGEIVRARAIGEAIVAHAQRVQADLIVVGSAPRWRRQSRFFSPTVDHVLRRAPCEVMVIAYPQGLLEQELSAT